MWEREAVAPVIHGDDAERRGWLGERPADGPAVGSAPHERLPGTFVTTEFQADCARFVADARRLAAERDRSGRTSAP